MGFGGALWRSATDLEGHVHAGAQALVEVLTRVARTGMVGPGAQPIPEIHALHPGLGSPVAVLLLAASPAAGRTLALLNLRGHTGATVLAISRGAEAIVAPVASVRLQAGDVLGLIGTHASIEAAKLALLGDAGGALPVQGQRRNRRKDVTPQDSNRRPAIRAIDDVPRGDLRAQSPPRHTPAVNVPRNRHSTTIHRRGPSFQSFMLGGTVTECDRIVKGTLGVNPIGWVKQGMQLRDDARLLDAGAGSELRGSR